jgi:hypothetical protein
LKSGLLAFLETRARQFARHRLLVILFVGLAPLVIRALLLPIFPIPAPRVHDEFSHLLIADTFAHGRLVNPAHPLWVHFESMHMLVRPVYAGIYPAAHGALMAVGQVLTGEPWIGVWLSVGFMCAALCWMLQGAFSPGWALLGGLLIAARFGVSSYWMNSYYGGAVPAAAGALVLGALLRLLKRERWQDAAVLGFGIASLANSRPYEGLVFSIPLAAYLLWRLRSRLFRPRIALPLILVLGASAAATGYYFAQFTGNPLSMPYQFFRATFTEAPHFIFQSPRPKPVYLHRQTEDYYSNWEMASYRAARENRSGRGAFDKAKAYARFYIGPFLAIPFIAALFAWRRARVRLLLVTGVLFAAALALEVWHSPHYAAPAMGAALLLMIEGLRYLRLAPAGKWIVAAICLGSFLLPVTPVSGFRRQEGRERQNILRQLEAIPGQHLVLTRYTLTHDPGDEWVYNGADIDGARVVWAREMDPASNQALLRHFQTRQVWLVEPDTKPIRLTPYDPSMPPDPPFHFVRLGTQAIEVLRSPAEVRQKLIEHVPQGPHSCDVWNRLFLDTIGVAAPDVTPGCFPAGRREEPVPFEQWFAWLQAQ